MNHDDSIYSTYHSIEIYWSYHSISYQYMMMNQTFHISFRSCLGSIPMFELRLLGGAGQDSWETWRQGVPAWPPRDYDGHWWPLNRQLILCGQADVCSTWLRSYLVLVWGPSCPACSCFLASCLLPLLSPLLWGAPPTVGSGRRIYTYVKVVNGAYLPRNCRATHCTHRFPAMIWVSNGGLSVGMISISP